MTDRMQSTRGEKCIQGLAYIMCVGLCFVAIPSFAAETGHHAEGHAADLVPYWINFGIYIVALIFLLRNPIASAWSARIVSIEASVSKGRKDREVAQSNLDSAKQRERSKEQTIQNLTLQIEKEAELEVEEVLRDGKERAARIAQQGKEMLQAEEKALGSDLKKMLADEVVRRAEQKLKGTMTEGKDEQRRVVKSEELKILVH